MGLFDFLKPSPEKQIARAKKALAVKDWALARDYVIDLDGDEAQSIRAEAMTQLVIVNLEAAMSWAEAGDDERVRVHMDLAAEHHLGGQEERFRAARKHIRELREAERARLEAEQKAAEKRLLDLQLPSGTPSEDRAPFDAIGDELVRDENEADELRARLTMILDGYAPALQEGLERLGKPFGKAILDLHGGRPDLALEPLVNLPDDEPLVRWERAQLASMVGDLPTAVSELQAFGRLAGGHHPMGRSHSGVQLAQFLFQTGQLPESLTLMRELRATSKDLGSGLYAQLLSANAEYPEADQVLRGLIKSYPLEPFFYKLLAHVRVQGGDRMAAMRALEQSIHQNCCATGTCSARPPDPETKRILARLYLEDGIETQRALELLEEAPISEKPNWDDLYTEALKAKITSDSRLDGLVSQLRTTTPPEDPRFKQIEHHFA